MVKNVRPSSLQVYESYFKAFTSYCQHKNLNVYQVRSHHFSRYLMYLFDQGLLTNTITTHRTSIASVLRHWRYDPATDPQIRLLIRSFRLARPVGRVMMLKWDIQVVLSGLCKPPFTNSEGSDDVIRVKMADFEISVYDQSSHSEATFSHSRAQRSHISHCVESW